MITIVVKLIKKLQIIEMLTCYLPNLRAIRHRTSIAFCVLIVACLNSVSAFAESSVWQVKKGEQRVYLAGTVHILPPDQFPLPEVFTRAYHASDAIVLETPMPDVNDLAFQQKLLKAVSYDDGQNLKQHLSDVTYEQLTRYLKRFQINIEQFQQFKPGYIATLMTMLEAKKAQLAGVGVDAHFAHLAQNENKPIEFLESQAFQLNLIADMGKGNEDVFIKATLSQMHEFSDMFSQLIPAWRNGDTQLLNTLVVKPIKEEDPMNYHAVLADRNKQWLPLIEQMFLDQDTELVLVGVGHLVGSDSVIKLLEDRGYQVDKMQ